MEDQEQKNPDLEANALESTAEGSTTNQPTTEPTKPPKQSLNKRIRGLISHLNIYLLLFILIVVLSGGIVFVGIQQNKKITSQPNINTTTLTKDTLNQIKNTDASVGDAKQTLTVASNAIFNGKVLMRSDLDVAGSIKIGGTLNVPGISVSGTSTFDIIQGNKLAITSDAIIQGQLVINKNLSVSAGGSFGGPISAPSITVQTLNLVGDLQFNRHISPGGATPSVVSYGSSLGSGGTASVSGSDSAGTLTFNIGGASTAGCFATVNFAQRYNTTPHIVISPSSSGAAGLNYYVTRTTSNFSVCSTSGGASGTITFDYIAVD